MADILLATADPQVAETVQAVLEAAQYALHIVDNGPDVLHYTGESGVDLYLLDHDLPLMPGLRVARHLRQSYEVARERIILLYPATLPPSYSAEVQADTVLITPFTGVELLLVVMRHLG